MICAVSGSRFFVENGARFLIQPPLILKIDVSEKTTINFILSSFSAPEWQIPDGFGYHFPYNSDSVNLNYQIISFSSPEGENLLFDGFNYYFVNQSDFVSSNYSLSSFSVNDQSSLNVDGLKYYFVNDDDFVSSNYNLSSFSGDETDLSKLYTTNLTTISAFKSSIYGVSANFDSYITQGRPGFCYWEISPNQSGPFSIVPFSANETLYHHFYGSNDQYDASIQPFYVRATIGYGTQLYKTNSVFLKPYESPLDIPNLQLWLDASDENTITRVPFFTDWSWYFNGSSQIIAPHNSNLVFGSNDFTIEFWCLFSSIPSGTIFSKRPATTGSGGGYCSIVIGASTGFTLNVTTNGSSWNISNQNISKVDIGVWQHVAVTRNGNVITFYKNGVNVYSVAITGSIFDRGSNVTIGGDSMVPAFFSKGYLSNFRIVNGLAVYPSDFSNNLPTAPLPLNLPGTVLQTLTRSSVLQDYSTSNAIMTTYGTPIAIDLNAQTCSSWSDKSSVSLTATQTAFGKQPFKSSLLFGNELNVVQFDGVLNSLDLSAPINVSNDFTHFFVYERHGSLSNQKTVSLGNLISDSTSPFYHGVDNYIYSGNKRSDSTRVVYDGLHISGVRKNQYLLQDGYSVPFTTNWGGAKTPSVSSVGLYSNNNFHKGAIGEIIQTSSMLPDSEMQIVHQQLYDKWFVTSLPPFNKTAPFTLGTTISSLSSDFGIWGRQPSSFTIRWQRSLDGITFNDIPSAISSTYNPTTADYGFYFRTSVSATNAFGTTKAYSDILRLTTSNSINVSAIRTSVFTVSAVPGKWVSPLPVNLFYRWQISAVDTFGWQNFGDLSMSNTVFLSSYSTKAINVRVFERPYNSTLDLSYA